MPNTRGAVAILEEPWVADNKDREGAEDFKLNNR